MKKTKIISKKSPLVNISNEMYEIFQSKVVPQGTLENEIFKIDKLSYEWSKILMLLADDDIENAFWNVLRMNDDVYLLRLMIKTGNCMHNLSFELQNEISQRVLQFENLEFLKNCVKDFLETEHNITNGLYSSSETTILKQQNQYKSDHNSNQQIIYFQKFNP